MEDRRTSCPNFSSLNKELVHQVMKHLKQDDWKQLRLVNRQTKLFVDGGINSIGLAPEPRADSRSDALHLAVNWNRWPALKTLDLSNVDLSSGVLKHYFEAGWTSLEDLNLFSCNLSSDDFITMPKETKLFANLRTLDLDSNKIQGDTMPLIFELLSSKLEELDLTINDLSNLDGGTLAAATATWPRLRSLDFSCTGITLQHVECLMKNRMQSLERLKLAYNDLGPELGRCLAQGAPQWPSLRYLEVSDNGLEYGGVYNLSKAAFLQLEEVVLEIADFGGPGEFDAEERSWPSLKTLTIQGRRELFKKAAQTFFSWSFTGLEALDIASLCLDVELAEDFAAAVHAGRLPKLKHLELPLHSVDAEVVAALLKHPLESLEYLQLSVVSNIYIAKALAAGAERLPALRQLEISDRSDQRTDNGRIIEAWTVLEGNWKALEELTIFSTRRSQGPLLKFTSIKCNTEQVTATMVYYRNI